MTESSILSTKSAQEYFRDLLSGAIANQRVPIGELTEFYLVNLLSRFMAADAFFATAPDGTREEEPLAFILARAMEGSREQKVTALRQLGDNSLYVAGFFGDSLQRRVVDVDYYISMGGAAYGTLANLNRTARPGTGFATLYDELCEKFVSIVDLFAEISERVAVSTNQGVVRLYERWVQTGSDRLSRLLAERGVIPFVKPKGIQ